MDSGRLPAYRSSYLLRFHPYPRTKLSARERITTSSSSLEDPYEPLRMKIQHSEGDAPFILAQVVHGKDVHRQVQLCQRRLSMSSLVIDLALLFTKTTRPRDP